MRSSTRKPVCTDVCDNKMQLQMNNDHNGSKRLSHDAHIDTIRAYQNRYAHIIFIILTHQK